MLELLLRMFYFAGFLIGLTDMYYLSDQWYFVQL